MKELADEFEKQFTSSGENAKKYITFSVPIKIEVTGIDKNGKESQKICLRDCHLLIAQDLWQAHYQILLIIFLKEFIELNVYTDTLIKNVKLLELNTKFTRGFLNVQTLKII